MSSAPRAIPSERAGERGRRRQQKGLDLAARLQLPRVTAAGVVVDDAMIRSQVKEAVRLTSLRGLAYRIGVSHASVFRYLRGRPVTATTIGRIRRWTLEPAETDVAQRLRSDLRRLLGPLGAARSRRVEGQVGRAICRAFHEAGLIAPPWTGWLGKKEV